MVTFSPPVSPIPGEYTLEPRVLMAGFGDGYDQKTGDGLNTQRRTYDNVQWPILSETDANTIEQFFEARGGFEAFDYTIPDGSPTRKFMVPRWSRRRIDKFNFAITATFREDFTLS